MKEIESNLSKALVPQVPATLAGLSLTALVFLLSSVVPKVTEDLSKAQKLIRDGEHFEKSCGTLSKDFGRLGKKVGKMSEEIATQDSQFIKTIWYDLFKAFNAFVLGLALTISVEAVRGLQIWQVGTQLGVALVTLAFLFRAAPFALGLFYLLMGARSIRFYYSSRS
jgi:hypothetical protein